MMYTESLGKLLRRAKGEIGGDMGPMTIPDLVELAYKSGSHDKFYDMKDELSACKKVIDEAERAMFIILDPKSFGIGHSKEIACESCQHDLSKSLSSIRALKEKK